MGRTGFFVAAHTRLGSAGSPSLGVGGGVNPLLFGGEDAVLQVV
jgi:hypothetical protein